MTLDPVLLSRLQFAFIIAFQFLPPAFTIGLAACIAVPEGLYLGTRCGVYPRISIIGTPTDLLAVTFNPPFPHHFQQTVVAAFLTTAFTVIGVAARLLRRGCHVEDAPIPARVRAAQRGLPESVVARAPGTPAVSRASCRAKCGSRAAARRGQPRSGRGDRRGGRTCPATHARRRRSRRNAENPSRRSRSARPRTLRICGRRRRSLASRVRLFR